MLQRVRDAIAALPQGVGPDGEAYTWESQKQIIVDELDPFLGEGSERRAEILLRTSGFQAFSSTIWNISQADEDTTHLQYIHGDQAKDPTPSHVALDGVVLPKDDPFWDTHTGPWGHLGCVCYVRPMNEDLVAEEQAKDDTKANPEDRNVVDGPALEQLRNGTFMRGGRRHDVSAPEGEGAFKWHPDDLRIPLDALKLRYDQPVWDAFHLWAMNTMVEPGTTVWQWLEGSGASGLTAKPKAGLASKPKSAQPVAPKPSTPVIPPLNSVQTRLKAAGFHAQIISAASAISAHASKFLDNLSFGVAKSGWYMRSKLLACFSNKLGTWSGEPMTALHEMGHHVHCESGIVTDSGVRQDFADALKADFTAWKKAQIDKAANIDWKLVYSRKNPISCLGAIGKETGIGDYNPSLNLSASKRLSRIADTIMGLSNGTYGCGHKYSYMKKGNNSAMEVFAHAFSAILQKDTVFEGMFENVVAIVRKEFKL